MNFDQNYCLAILQKLLAIDSTTGQFRQIQDCVSSLVRELGYDPIETHKGGLIVDLGGEGNPLVVTAHLDDIGLMVRHINEDGTLNVCPVGGLYPFYCVMENVRVHTRDGKVYSGTINRIPNSLHVTEEELRDVPGDFRKNVCVVLDEDVRCAEDTQKLGIATGDLIGIEPRYQFVNGYVKAHFIDDKAAAALLLNVMKTIREEKIILKRKVYAYFAMYEEIGHGTAYLPDGVKDVLAVDIAPIGPQQNSDEKKVSIFAKDSRFPYHYEFSNELRKCAIDHRIDYVMDIFTPHYGTDADGSVLAGYDIRHAAIGFGTRNSHGYERTHVDGLRNTYELLLQYLKG